MIWSTAKCVVETNVITGGRLVPDTNAAALIGHINPGVGYWWYQTNGQWFLWVPSAPGLADLWPSLIWPVVVVAGGIIGVMEFRQKKRRGAK